MIDGLLRVAFYADDQGGTRMSYLLEGDVRLHRIIGDLTYIAHDFMHMEEAHDVE